MALRLLYSEMNKHLGAVVPVSGRGSRQTPAGLWADTPSSVQFRYPKLRGSPLRVVPRGLRTGVSPARASGFKCAESAWPPRRGGSRAL